MKPAVPHLQPGLLALLLTLVPSPDALAQDQAQVERQLESVRQEIQALTADQQATRSQADRELEALQTLEKEIASLARAIIEADNEIARLETEQMDLDREETRLRDALARHEQALAEQVRAAHAFGRQPGLRLMLDVDDPARVARVLNYYRYYGQARLNLMREVDRRLADLAAVVQRQQRVREELLASRQQLSQRQDARQQARAQRLQVVRDLRANLAQQARELEVLGQDQARLTDLLAQLQRLLADLPGGFSDAPFSSRKGRLPWPVTGRLELAPGVAKPDGMSRESAVISADAGVSVQAVSYGRVAFADWLRGFGLLVVLDHGEGYMSLYGFNETLLVDVGDWVVEGEAIAQVGRSGAREGDSLYFEIRHDGRPVKATDWLSGRSP